MRKLALLALLTTFFTACGNADSDKSKMKEDSSSEITSKAEYKKGLALIAGSDCLTCHQIDDKFTGPSYREIANKYADRPDTAVRYLAGKIIEGGKGVWGEVFMTPHTGLPQEDAEAMVKYILLLKNK